MCYIWGNKLTDRWEMLGGACMKLTDRLKQIEKYSSAICCIDDIETYIISPEHYSFLIENQELLENLIPSWAMDWVIRYVQVTKKFDALYLAFGHHKNRAVLSFEWEPVLCYEKENTFFHVRYRDSWMCRNCRYVLYAPIIIPLCEADPGFYYETKNRFPDTPPFFQKVPCPKCSSLLQNHLIILE